MDPQAEIPMELERIDKDEAVCIVYACESGSWAWGFESRDSDYDVRFLYLHPPEWYLRVMPGPSVIERPPDAVLDISGPVIRPDMPGRRRR
jgi:predicted nucleotidyltransferase